jgi:hypothetical protein
MSVFVTRSAEASPSLDPDSPAQASLSTAAARESLAFRKLCFPKEAPPGSAHASSEDEATPMFHGPSWDDHFCVPLCFHTPKGVSAASRKRKIISSGASSRLTPEIPRRFTPLPAGRDRFFGCCRSVLPEGPLKRLRPPSRSPIPYGPRAESLKAQNGWRSLWITGISCTVLEPFRFCRFTSAIARIGPAS